MPLLELLSQFVPSIALLSYCLLLLFFTLAKKDKNIRMFIVVLLGLIVWTAPAILMQTQVYPGVLFWHRIMIAGMLFTPFLIYLFVSVYTASISIFYIILWGLVAGGSMILNLLGYVIVTSTVVNYDIAIGGRHFNGVEFVYTVGPMAYLLFSLMFIMILAIIIRAWKSIKSGNVTYDQIGLIIIGVSIMFLGTLINSLALHKYPIAVLGCFVNAILMTIAIYKYRMLELRFIITRGIAYSVFALVLTAIYVYLVLFVQRQINGEAVSYFFCFKCTSGGLFISTTLQTQR